MTLSDFNAALAALIVHFGLAYALVKAPAYVRRHASTIEFDVRKIKVQPPEIQPPAPLPPPPVTPPAPTPPVKKVRVKHEPTPPTPPKAPIPNETKEPPKDPPKEPPKPVFGASMSSTTEGPSSFSVDVGNSLTTDQKNRGKPSEAKPLPPAPPNAVPAPIFRPASPLEIKDYPDPDESSCQIPGRLYPEEARQQGIEGTTQLRVEIDHQGKVHGVRVIAPAGGGPAKALDTLAVQWMRTHCRFKPARNTANQSVSAVITYTFRWQIDR